MKEAKPDAWMPLYVGDWDGDTGHLDCEQDGAYGRLIRWYWRKGPLPDDDAALARIIRMDLKRWRKIRPVIAAFFVVADGQWRQKRVDLELVRWSEKKAAYSARASAGGKAKAAKSSASSTAKSTRKAVLKTCSSSSSTEVDAPSGQSTLCGRESADAGAVGASPPRAWKPDDVVEAFTRDFAADWLDSYFWPCSWQDVPVRALVAANGFAAAKIQREARQTLAGLNIQVLEKAA